MTEVKNPDPGGRGRPRSKRAEEAILEATAQLLTEEGFAALTIEDVAERAGVGKATIYRWWETKGTLAFDAFATLFLATQPLPDTGSLRGDLLGALRGWIKTVDGTATGRTLVGLIGEVQRDPALASLWRSRFVVTVREQHLAIIERAIERGEIPASTDTEVTLDLLFGSAYHRLLHSHLPLTDEFAVQVVSIIAAGLEHSTEPEDSL